MAKAALIYSLLVLVGFCFGQQQPMFQNSAPERTVQYSHCALLYSADFLNARHFPFSNPFFTQLISEEVEMPDDMAAADSFEIKCSGLFQNPFLDKALETAPQKNLFTQLSESIQNRTTASLFVLHHSWKSFLV